ncbi:HK97 gp10 family phage protein [Lederbergia lenta]|uniref:HK97 gp10 family phage protein n=1 Tax=Lederbergia lenta TaxID=1467 RepID=UPI002041352A|nr:HK97 gp10 family phage protein [Lederbergia lenta]MCM3111680.1 HK97 gp10 family phage protein [Lederbergia lenta]
MADINSFVNEIMDALHEYSDEVEEGLEEAQEKAAKDGAKILKATSPKGKTGKYGKGWKATRRGKGWVIHNATRYQLSHLLEKGHAKRGGGRVPGRVHIAPVEDQVIKQFEQDVERVIRG